MRENLSRPLLLVTFFLTFNNVLGHAQAAITSFSVSGTAIKNSDVYASGVVRLRDSKTALISSGGGFTSYECEAPAQNYSSPSTGDGCTIPTPGPTEGEFLINVRFYVGYERGESGQLTASAAIFNPFGTVPVTAPLNYISPTYALSLAPATVYTDAVNKTLWATVTRSVPPRANQPDSVKVHYTPQIVRVNYDSYFGDDFASVTIPGGATSAQFPIDYPVVTQPTSVTLTAPNTTATFLIDLPPSGQQPDSGPCKQCEAQVGEPINVTNGNTWVTQTDYAVSGSGGGLNLTRTWNSLWQSNQPVSVNGVFGHSWRSTLDERIQALSSPSRAIYWRADGSNWTFNYDSLNSVYYLAEPVDERASLAVVAGVYTLTLVHGEKRVFDSNGKLQKIVDRNGNETILTYDTVTGRVTAITSGERSLSLAYGDANNPELVTQIQDGAVVASYTYEAPGRLTTVTYADGGYIFAYDTDNLLLSVKDAARKVLEAHTYDGSRRGLSSERANGAEKVTVAYPQTGSATVTDSSGRVTNHTYQLIGRRRFITSVSGNGCFSCGAEGSKSFVYDTTGNRTTATNDAGQRFTYQYDANGNVTVSKRTLTLGAEQTYTYTYNSFGQVLTATDPLGNVTTNAYDAKGNLLSITSPSPDGVLPGSVTSFEYDLKGQLTKVIDPRNGMTTMTYTAAGMVATVTDAGNQVTAFEYDRRGNRTAIVDALSQRTTFAYDAMNRLISVTLPDNTISTFAYDGRGRQTSVAVTCPPGFAQKCI